MRCSNFCCAAFLFFLLSTTAAAQSLVLRSAAPRFLRPGDRLELLLHIKNKTNKELTGQSELQLQDATSSTAVDGWFQNFFPNQYFTAAGGDSATVRFPVEVPYTFFKTARLRFVASAASDTASTNTLIPVLPYRPLFNYTALQRGSGTFTIPQLLHSAANEQLQHASLKVHMAATPAAFAYAALNSLLIADTISSFAAADRLFASALLLHLSHQHPHAATAIFPNRSDTALLRQQLVNAIALIQQFRQASGGFAWWPGGPADAAATEYMALTAGRLLQLNVLPAPQQKMVQTIGTDALKYLNNARLPLSAAELAYLEGLLGKNEQDAKKSVQISATLGNEPVSMQALMAAVLMRRGEGTQANTVLDLALRKKPTATEPASAPMYSLVSETALLLEAATLLHHSAADSLSMALLQQKNTEGWPTPSATTGAAYAILLHNKFVTPMAAASIKIGNLPQRTTASTYWHTTAIDAGLVHPSAGNLTLQQSDTGNAPIALAQWQYFDEPAETMSGIAIERQIFLLQKGRRTPWTEGQPLNLGDTLEVKLQLNASQAKQHLQLSGGWPAGFVPIGKATTNNNFFERAAMGQKEWWLSQLPAGRSSFTYQIKAVYPGSFSIGATELKEAITGKTLATLPNLRVHVD